MNEYSLAKVEYHYIINVLSYDKERLPILEYCYYHLFCILNKLVCQME